MNHIVIIGNLCGDPEAKQTSSGIPCANFRVAVQRDYKNANGERETDFLNCSAFRSTATFVTQFAHKGDKIAVCGKLQTRNFTAQDGSKRNVVEIVADSVEITHKGEKKPSGGAGDFTEVEDDNLPF